MEEEVFFLQSGESIQDPLFNDLSVSFDGAKKEVVETITAEAGSEDGTLKFTNVDGNEYTLNLFTAADDDVKEVTELTITNAATADGNIVVDGTDVAVTAAAQDTVEKVVDKIDSRSFFM
jgi:hypothetical protein